MKSVFTVEHFKPGDEVLIDLHVVATVKQIGPVKNKLKVAVPEGTGSVLIWHVDVSRCIPNTRAARLLYVRT